MTSLLAWSSPPLAILSPSTIPAWRKLISLPNAIKCHPSLALLAASSAFAASPLEARSRCKNPGTFGDGGPYDLIAVDKNWPSAPGVRLTLSPAVSTTESDRRNLAVSVPPLE